MGFDNKNIDRLMETPIMKNLRNTPNIAMKEAPELITPINPVHKTNKTIEELKEIIVEQGITADKQAKTIMRMTILALVFAFISIVPVLREYIPIIAPKNHDRDIYELKSKVLSLSNTNLENQVNILKTENELLNVKNELLKAKTTSEKEKKKP